MAEPSNGAKLLCLLQKRIIGLGAVAVAVIAIFTAASHLDRYRWWASAEEIRTVASRVYQLSVPEQRRVITSVERDLKSARAVPPENRDINDSFRINRLEEELLDAKEEMKKLIGEQKQFGSR